MRGGPEVKDIHCVWVRYFGTRTNVFHFLFFQYWWVVCASVRRPSSRQESSPRVALIFLLLNDGFTLAFNSQFSLENHTQQNKGWLQNLFFFFFKSKVRRWNLEDGRTRSTSRDGNDCLVISLQAALWTCLFSSFFSQEDVLIWRQLIRTIFRSHIHQALHRGLVTWT